MRFSPPKINLPAMPVREQGPALPRGGMGAPTGTGLGPKPMGAMGGIRNAVNQAIAQAPVRPVGSPAAPSGGIVAKAAPGMGLGPGGMKKGGKVSSASKRADGIAVKGKTKGRII